MRYTGYFLGSRVQGEVICGLGVTMTRMSESNKSYDYETPQHQLDVRLRKPIIECRYSKLMELCVARQAGTMFGSERNNILGR